MLARCRTLVATLLLLLLIESSASSIALSYMIPDNVRKISVAALAVTEEGEGVVIQFNLWVMPGNGDLRITGNKDLLSSDVVTSLNFSTWLASRISSVPHNKYDFYVDYTGERSVAGLSATLLFTLGFTVLLNNIPWDGNATATGLITPAGIVCNVSSVTEKYKAALGAGFDRILAPIYPELLGKHHYIPVVSIVDSYDYFVLRQLFPRYDSVYEDLLMNRSSVFSKVLYDSWKYFYNRSMDVLGKIGDKINAVSNPEIRRYYEKGVSILNESLSYVDKKLYYTAASRAFYSFWLLYTVLVYVTYTGKHVDLEKYIDMLDKEIGSFYRKLVSLKNALSNNMTLYDIDIFLNVYERFYDSIMHRNISIEILSRNTIDEELLLDYASNISYAIAKIEAAEQWLKFIDLRRNMAKTTISPEILRRVVENEYGLLYSYALLLESLGFNNTIEFVKKQLKPSWVIDDDLALLARIIWIERDLNDMLLSIPEYTLLIDLVREGIRRSVVRLLEYFYMYHGVLVPSAYTALEFYHTSEDYGVFPLTTSMLHMLVLYEIACFKEPLFHEPLEYRITLLYTDRLVLISIVLITLGSFIIGYSIGIYGRKV